MAATKKPEGWTTEQIRKWSGAHVMLYAGDGHNRPQELIFSSSAATESTALCRTLLRLLEDRVTMRCPECLDVPGKDGLGRTCNRCKGAGRIPREHQ